MADISTDPARYGDSDEVLILKLAKAAQTFAGVVNTTEIEKGSPQYGDPKNTNLLRFAYAVQQL